LALIAAAPWLPAIPTAEAMPALGRFEFLDTLPAPNRYSVADDAKLLIGWATDAAALESPLRGGDIVDRTRGFATVPGFAAPTDMTGLAGRYRVMAAPYADHRYYGLTLGLLDGGGQIGAIVVVNRLFRLPVLLEEPGGLAVDLWANAGLLLGFRTLALDAALALAAQAAELAARYGVPLITTGQSQAGGTAQLQIASLVAARARLARPIGFLTFNANCAPASIRRFGLEPARVPGINFAKDRDPFVGPHSGLANAVGLQVYIHADGTAGLTPRGSYLQAAIRPREHFLDSFNGVSLAAAIEAIRE
jgi:hypothetical protein